jgi:hypothetical protein
MVVIIAVFLMQRVADEALPWRAGMFKHKSCQQVLALSDVTVEALPS